MNRMKIFMKGLEGFWRKYRKDRLAVVGLVIVIFFIVTAFLGPLIAPFDPLRGGEEAFGSPSLRHLMGTDDLGRDVFSGILYGSVISLTVGFLAVATSTTIGVFVGGISGFYGGIIDDFLMRITEMFQLIPPFFLALTLMALFGPSIWNIILAIGVSSWPKTARLVRAAFLSLKTCEFVEAARMLGAGDANLIFDEIFINATPIVITNGSLEVAKAILYEAGFSFLGLGDPNVVSWGSMLYNAQRFIRYSSWMMFFPGLAIFLTVLGVNLVGNGLNIALNPRLNSRGVDHP